MRFKLLCVSSGLLQRLTTFNVYYHLVLINRIQEKISTGLENVYFDNIERLHVVHDARHVKCDVTWNVSRDQLT